MPIASYSIKTPQALGKCIRSARRAQGLTLIQASALCGVGIRFLSELERGKPTAELGKTLHVLKRLGLSARIAVLRKGPAARTTPMNFETQHSEE